MTDRGFPLGALLGVFLGLAAADTYAAPDSCTELRRHRGGASEIGRPTTSASDVSASYAFSVRLGFTGCWGESRLLALMPNNLI
jgi:hypothetical protein